MYFLKSDLLEKRFDQKILVFVEKEDSFISLSGVSLIIWCELKKSSEIKKIVSAIRREFDVGVDEAKKDIHNFIKKLLDLELIEKKN